MSFYIKSTVQLICFIIFSTFFTLAAFAQVSSLPNGFPSNDAGEGKLVMASQGLNSLGAPPADGTVFNVHIRVPVPPMGMPSEFSIELFDPDIFSDANNPGYWDFPALNLTGGFTAYEETTSFELYPDFDISGNSTTGMIHQLITDPTMDNQWVDFGTFTVDAGDAACQQGPDAEFCFYHLVARWVEPTAPHTPKLNATTFGGNIANGFIVASDGLPFLAAGSTTGIIGTVPNPSFPVPATSYDGNINFRALVTDPDGQCFLDIYDGDSDYAGQPFLDPPTNSIPNPSYPDENDDPNTPNDGIATGFFPFVLSSATVEEGVMTGVPPDNSDSLLQPSLGVPIQYTLSPEPPTAPYGVDCCVNDNPSGEREWELTRIGSLHPDCSFLGDPDSPTYDPDDRTGAPIPDVNGPAPAAAADEKVNFIGPGFHALTIQGMDTNNINFLNVSVDIFAGEAFDFGDAPNDNYGTVIASNGPQHDIDDRLTLGARVDAEFEGAPSVAADGDDTDLTDDEDGVGAFAALDTDMVGEFYDVDVTVRNETGDVATLFGWIDFNQNDVFDPATEAASISVSPGETAKTLMFVVPADIAAGDTYARFRLTTDLLITTATTGGLAEDGEVEDYLLTIDEGEECIPCKGMKTITFKMSQWSHSRDPDETVRVRVGNLPGDFFGTNNYDAPILFEGKVPNGGEIVLMEGDIPEQYWGMPLTISVQDEEYPFTHHKHEWGKAVFYPDCDLQLWTESGNSYIKFKVTAFMKNSEDEDCPETCPSDFSFEKDSAGNDLIAGQIIDNEFIGYGITVTTNDPTNHPAMIFDSANPTGDDPDLGTPNQDFGGPGVGSGGGAGQPGQNDVAENKILIISEDGDSNDPDDNAAGGTLFFNLADPLDIKSLTLIDVETSETYSVRAYDSGNGLINSVNMNGLGNNSRINVNLNADAVSRLEVQFSSSGGVANIKFKCPGQCPTDDTSGYVKDHFTYKSYNNNDGNRDWSGPWEESDSRGGGATGGNVRIYYGKLLLRKTHSSIEREVDVCASTNVWLKFRYKMSHKVDPSDKVAVEVSPDGGTTWHLVDEYSGRHGWTTRNYNISQYASENMRVRFRISKYYGGSGEWFYVNWVKITSD